MSDLKNITNVDSASKSTTMSSRQAPESNRALSAPGSETSRRSNRVPKPATTTPSNPTTPDHSPTSAIGRASPSSSSFVEQDNSSPYFPMDIDTPFEPPLASRTMNLTDKIINSGASKKKVAALCHHEQIKSTKAHSKTDMEVIKHKALVIFDPKTEKKTKDDAKMAKFLKDTVEDNKPKEAPMAAHQEIRKLKADLKKNEQELKGARRQIYSITTEVERLQTLKEPAAGPAVPFREHKALEAKYDAAVQHGNLRKNEVDKAEKRVEQYKNDYEEKDMRVKQLESELDVEDGRVKQLEKLLREAKESRADCENACKKAAERAVRAENALEMMTAERDHALARIDTAEPAAGKDANSCDDIQFSQYSLQGPEEQAHTQTESEHQLLQSIISSHGSKAENPMDVCQQNEENLVSENQTQLSGANEPTASSKAASRVIDAVAFELNNAFENYHISDKSTLKMDNVKESRAGEEK